MKRLKNELFMLVLAVAILYWTLVFSGELPAYLLILALLGGVLASLDFVLLCVLKMKRPCEDCPHTTKDQRDKPKEISLDEVYKTLSRKNKEEGGE